MEHEVFSKSPLKLCLLQTVFSPIVNMEKYIPEIQDCLRKEGFPLFSERILPLIDFESNGAKNSSCKQWIFQSSDLQELLVVDLNLIVYQVFEYEKFEIFFARYKSIIKKFFEILQFFPAGVINRIGLRYINVIRDDNWKKYLNKSYQGIELPSNIVKDPKTAFTSSMMQSGTKLDLKSVGNIIVKIYQNNQGIDVPADIVSNTQIIPTNKLVTFIDIDHFVQFSNTVKINFEQIQEFTEKLHRVSSIVFLDSISEEAKKTWK